MMTERHRIVWLLVLILTVPALASAARRGRLIGKIVDPEGNPIPGVTVIATSAEIPDFKEVVTTDDKGLFKIDFDRLFVVYHYRLERPGYLTADFDHEWNFEGTRRQEFTLHPGEAPTTESVPLASASRPAIEAFNAGVLALKAGDSATAEAKFKEASELDPYLRQAWAALSAIHLEQKRYKEAVESAEKAIALGSRGEEVLWTRWEAYRNLGDEVKTAEAREDLERFGRLTEEAKRIYNEGVALSRAGDDEGAFKKFQNALEVDPDLHVALLGLATTAVKIDRSAEAAAAAETILDADPQNEQALRIRYNAALKLGDEAKVADALVGLAAVDPVTARDGLFKLATAAYDSDNTVKAKQRFGTILELDPNHPRSHYFLGLLLMREGARAEAKSHLERFLELAPDDPDAGTAKGALTYLKGS